MQRTLETALEIFRQIEDGAIISQDYIRVIRYELQQILEDHIKQGQVIEITKPFNITCTYCQAAMADEPTYLKHLLEHHNLEQMKANFVAAKPRIDYEMGLADLTKLLEEFTEASINEPGFN